MAYGFNLGQIEGLDSSVQTVTLTIANQSESNTYTLNKANEDPLVWSDNPDPESAAVYIMLTDGVAGLYVVAFTESDVGDAYNVTLSTSAVEENFKSAVETVLADNGLISEPETIFDETLTLTDEELFYELPSDFPDGWYENAVCTVNGVEIPKDPDEDNAFKLETDLIYVHVVYIPPDDEYPATLDFSYCDVPNDYAIIPGDYQVKIVAQVGSGGGDSSGLPDVSASDNGSVLGVINGEWSVDDRLKDYPSISDNNGDVLGFGLDRDGNRVAQSIVPAPLKRNSYSNNTFYLPFKDSNLTQPQYFEVNLENRPNNQNLANTAILVDNAQYFNFNTALLNLAVPGTYTLKANVDNGLVSFEWVKDT